MSQETFMRLEHLRHLNSNRQWVNEDVYRLMYKEDLYMLAYERIKSKPGNMTPGTDEETLDGFSLEAIREIIQEVMQMILEAIYDSPHGPYFQETSHGFRPNRSCHTALREFRGKWTAMNWLIEGDIRACFDELDLHVLVTLLHKKIHDQRFLNLIWKLLKAGYMDLHGTKRESLIGSPQGSLVSPILANVYLHELDEFVEELRQGLEKGEAKHRDPTYRKISKEKARMAARGEPRTKEFKAIVKLMRTLPSRQVDDPEFIRIRYLRYADDWCVGVSGSHALAEEIKQRMKTFLWDHLKLTLSEEKTQVTNARTEEAFFLGTTLKIGNGGTAKVKQTTNGTGKTFKRRTTGWETVMNAPLPRLVKRLSERGFCTTEGEPTPKSGWAFLDAEQMVSLYSSVNRGIQNYYRFVDNWGHLNRIQYILQCSLAKTLARKYQISMTKVFKRFGKQMTIHVAGKDGKKDREVSFYLNHDWTKRRDAFQEGKHSDIDLVQTAMRMRTRSKLGKPCCICGEVEQTAMHHVRHIRKLSHKRVATGFNRVLRALNRKQIPVCTACHVSIHRGEYDGIKLSDLAYIPR